jgi:hypothetical protein
MSIKLMGRAGFLETLQGLLQKGTKGTKKQDREGFFVALLLSDPTSYESY